MNTLNILLNGLIYTILGMTIVFIVLILHAYLAKSLKVFSGSKNENNNVSLPIDRPNSQYIRKPENEETISEEMENEEIVAVIEAAIYAAYKDVGSFKVKSIKRIQDNMPEWRKAGIFEQMNSR
ncbi:OadG family protein [Thermoanaerobacterium sp. RBIITD]|uniref:OadG family protein n=1 Tax=Thermoanaerobacterium sp. RBIITD TaxID=1550240 RepID=UPI000BB8ED56|nr:OadG family protein [Thermoanaerobacterium sp. RBIITD]SNX54299.1 sodium pump decarboxylases, gamma subunit [Thermoanaerobacterium sp. RBIITD]